MEAPKALSLLMSAFFLVACGNKKTTETVFDQSIGHACESMSVDGEYIVQWEDGRITTESYATNEKFVSDFVEPNLDLIKIAEKNKKIFLHPTALITDSFDEVDNWGQDAIQAQQVWSQGIYGQGIKVAVVDAGVDYDHPQIQPRLDKNLLEFNGLPNVDDDDNGFIDDIYGWDFFANKAKAGLPSQGKSDHGTHVAGIIAADHNTGEIKGVAPQATIIPVKFLDPEKGGNIDDGIKAIKYAVSRGAKIINASWGGDAGPNGEGCSTVLREVISSIEKKGVLFVAAAGNEGANTDYDLSRMSFPASYTLPNIISVAASSSNGALASFSNYGFKRVHISAPGNMIWSTVFSGTYPMPGTSMASPMVAGAAALLWSAKPNATYAQIRQALFSSVVSINGFQSAVSTKGHLNLPRALQELNRIAP
jgi:subtilisin family serine protease